MDKPIIAIIFSILSSIITIIISFNIQLVDANYITAQETAKSIINERLELISELKKLETQSFHFQQLYSDNMVYGDILNNFDSKVPESVINELRSYEADRLFLFSKISLNYGESVNKLIDVYNSGDDHIFIGPAHLWRLRIEMIKTVNQSPVQYNVWLDLLSHIRLTIMILFVLTLGYWFIFMIRKQRGHMKYLNQLDQHIQMICERKNVNDLM